ncbi:SPFH domain-containing protein [Ostreibacterium oceani]|uniref:DUF4339 domain-containing protein n=1 Tax=Ostreibacterium oceani TaxID=2654998 RepID=A0A6N7EUF1_9GAMM|nr:SPFH domain-containing protein [Ostreibacterium oceani]MPV86414.1 DUF4339 domain-containing protein [Ostreibacterium oceani]
MGLMNWLGGELVDIIEWTQTDDSTMAYRFPRYRNEIKFGAKLTVREGQVAILVNLGQLADVFTPGIYELKTENLPVLSSLQHWQHGFESPFKAEVYFFNTTDFLSLKWGTKQAITLTDQTVGLIRLRAFGSYTIRIADAAVFFRKLVGTDGNFEIDEVSEHLSQALVARFSEQLASEAFSISTLASKYSELASSVTKATATEFAAYGLEIGQLYIENISLPEKVQQVLDDKTGLTILGDDLGAYTQMQAAKGMESGGSGSDMASAGVGMALGMQMAREMTQENDPVIPQLPKTYYLMVNGQRVGPLALNTVQDMLLNHDINSETMCWKKGMKEWMALEMMSEFETNAIPPPFSPSSQR